jgi:prepilin-type N-terminal cleavage/methylation domain-containing protein
MTRRERGFSLVEMMVAMLITLIVSGAIYGLMAAGGNAFQREPELADRQQNIRVAMDSLTRDVYQAGAGLPTFSQVFSRQDPAGACVAGLNGCGVAGSLGVTPAGTRAPGDGGDPSTNSDVLELVTIDERCPSQTVCSAKAGGTANSFATREGVPACFNLPGLALLTDNVSVAIQPASVVAPMACDTGGSAARNGALQLAAPLAPWTSVLPLPTQAVPPNQPVVFVYAGRVVRYRIGNSTDTQDTAPALWRSASGRYATDGSTPTEPGVAGFTGAGLSPWELVARGIEDLQVEYMGGDLVWRNRPPTSVNADWTSLVRKVRITLSARTSAPNLQGQTTAGGAGPNAVRGQLVTEIAPRASYGELQMANPPQIR